MFQQLRSSLLLAPALLGLFSLAAVAEQAPSSSTLDQVSTYTQQAVTPVGQVTSVSQLSDVRPTDWAFQSLQSLVERYGCIAGYPDKTFRGNRALTRYEFAAGLNACLNRVNELIAASGANAVSKEDVDAIKKLTQEYADDLEVIRGKVDSLDASVTKLEKQAFSTTTKLNVEVIGTLSEAFGDNRAVTSDQQKTIDATTTAAARDAAINNAITGSATNANTKVRSNPILANRVRINFDSSFTGLDRLRTRLQARNITSFSGTGANGITGTNMTRLGYDGSNSNSVELSRLEYRFPLNPLTTVFIGGGTNDGLEYNDIVNTLSPVDSSANGSISRFGRFNPIFRSATGSGIVVNRKLGGEYTMGNKFTLSLGYLVPTATAADPGVDKGLFSGDHSALAQLVFQPTPNIGLGVTYANAYYASGSGTSGGTGSGFANSPFGAIATSANQVGVQADVRLNPKFTLFGWAGYTNAVAKGISANTAFSATANVNKNDKASIWNWAVGVALPDFLKEGNLAGIIFGMPPKVTSTDYGPNTGATATTARRRDNGTSYHLEAFYRYKLNDNMSITPGVLVLFNPEHNNSNPTEYVGTVRTTFTF